MAVLLGVALAIVAVGYLVGVVPVVVGLFLFGFANGAWDVAMNVQGAVVERHLGRSIMSRFHAGFSLGTVAGALVGAAMVALGVPVTAHLVVVAVAGRRGRPAGRAALRAATPAPSATPAEPGGRGPTPRGRWPPGGSRAPCSSACSCWRSPSPRAPATTGSASRSSTATARRAALGTLAFAVFLAAMTAGRWFGPALLDRYGRVPVVRVLAVLGVVGLLLFVFGPTTPLAFVGALLWGLGHVAGLPGRDERRRRRPGAGGRAGSASSPRSATAPSSPARR